MFKVQRFKVKGFILLLVASSFNCYSQDFQKEINTQVWTPFIQTFNQRDTEGFMLVHSKDLVRAPRDSKSIQNFEQYEKENRQWESHTSKRTIELRFIERLASEDQAYEVGIYKTSSSNEKGEMQSFYGKFHVVMRKENRTWKILVDSDSSEGGTIGEKDFLAAKPMQ
jgi:ketosteroid isomerase-like protein